MTVNAIEMVEESVELLRRSTARDLATYLLGTAPFLIAVILFIEDAGRPSAPLAPLPLAALGVALLFVWMGVWQAVFCARLRERLSQIPQPVSLAALFRLHAVVQPTKLIVLPLAFAALIPFGPVLAFYQNVAARSSPPAEPLSASVGGAARLSGYASRSNWIALGLISLFALTVLINAAVLLGLAPQLLRVFTGIDTPFSASGAAGLVNRTFMMAAIACTYIIVDPLLKAFYVLRCFHAESVASGLDLATTLRRAITTTAAAVILLLSVVPSPAQSIAPERLDQSIEQTLQKPEYRWKVETRAEPEGWTRSLAEALSTAVRWLGDRINDLLRLFEPKAKPPAPGGAGATGRPELVVAAYVLSAVALAGIGFLLWRTYRKRDVVPAVAVEVAAPIQLDVHDLSPSDLPEDEWIRMAREKAAAGELRLALRALYLASISMLARRNLVTVTRGKSNHDYVRELRRRGRSDAGIIDAFESNVAIFERSWYGRHEVTEELFSEFESGYRRLAHEG